MIDDTIKCFIITIVVFMCWILLAFWDNIVWVLTHGGL